MNQIIMKSVEIRCVFIETANKLLSDEKDMWQLYGEPLIVDGEVKVCLVKVIPIQMNLGQRESNILVPTSNVGPQLVR